MNTSTGKLRFSVLFIAALTCLAIFYFRRIFSNVCIDLDTLNWVIELSGKGDRLTLLNSIACMGWYSKFHLSLFPIVYVFTRAYSPVGGWDVLMGFKILTFISTLGAFLLVFFLCKETISRPPLALLTSIVPFLTLGPCWMATTCDDNTISAFFEILFLVTIFICCRSLKSREGKPTAWGFASGVTAALSLAIHLKNLVSLPVLIAPVFVKPSRRKSRFRTLAAASMGLLLTFGALYLLFLFMMQGQPSGARYDFYVFHRQPGRFFFTRYESSVGDWLYFILVGIRSTLYTFQELCINTNLFDRDLLGPALLFLFFFLYAVAVIKTANRLATRLLCAFFICHLIHSSLYDSWVSERWDAIVVPVIVTVGIFWDSVLSGGRTRKARTATTMAVLLLFGGLVAANFVQSDRLMAITGGRRPYTKSAVSWPYPKKAFFFFNHSEYYRLAKEMDNYFDEKTGFIPLRYTQPSASHAVACLDKYLRLYSKGYRTRQIEDLTSIESLVRSGRLNRILFIDELKVPFFHEEGRRGIVFTGGETRTVFEGKQVTLKEMRLVAGGTEGG